MTGDLSSIARTLTQEFASAVEAAEGAMAAGINDTLTRLKHACDEYDKSLRAVEDLERQAAELIQRARHEKLKGKEAFDGAIDVLAEQISAMRAAKLPARRRLKSLPGGRADD